jgi:hypothetical protein
MTHDTIKENVIRDVHNVCRQTDSMGCQTKQRNTTTIRQGFCVVYQTISRRERRGEHGKMALMLASKSFFCHKDLSRSVASRKKSLLAAAE